MPASSLQSCNFGIAYGPTDDRIRDFFIPALSNCSRCDCMIGSLPAFILTDALEGISRLVGNRGSIRLQAGVEIDEADAAAMRGKKEMSEVFIGRIMPLLDSEDRMVRRNLETLAWLVADETLRIRLLPRGKSGENPPAKKAEGAGIPMTSVFVDGDGFKIAQQNWPNDRERFFVFKSWDASAPYLEALHRHFEGLWEGGEPGRLSLPLPPALRDRLIQLKPPKSPLREVRDLVAIERPEIDPSLREKLFFQFLRDMKQFPGEPTAPSSLELEEALTGSGMLKACWERHPEIQKAWILGWQGKRIAVTFDPEIFSRHPETLLLMSYGEPLLQSLLQGIVPLKTPDACQIPLIRFAADAPVPLAAYYSLATDEIRAVATPADLAAVLNARMGTNGPSALAEARAREHFSGLVRDRRKARSQSRQAIHRAALRKLEEKGKRILVRAALCDIARAGHATLFDHHLIAADFDEQTILRQGEKSPSLAELLSLIHSAGLKPDAADPFWADVEGKPEKTIRGLEDSLVKEARALLREMADLKGGTPEDVDVPAVDVKRFYKRSQREKQPLMLAIAPPKKERFTRYLPFYTIPAAAEKFGGSGASKEEGWMPAAIDPKPKKTMFVVQVKSRSMAPILDEDSLAVFDADVPDFPDGLILMVRNARIDDPDLGKGITIRRCHFSGRIETGKTFRFREIRMEPENPEYKTIVLKDVAPEEFRIIGRYVGGI